VLPSKGAGLLQARFSANWIAGLAVGGYNGFVTFESLRAREQFVNFLRNDR
jgi:hypothetical protein